MNAREEHNFLQQIRSIPSLDRQREADLAARWLEHGDRRAADELIRSSLKQVVPIAMRYRGSGEPLDDLVAEGSLGLMHALNKFDPGRGNRFKTYAQYWIQAYLTRYVRRCRSIVSTPLHDDATLYARIVSMRRFFAASSQPETCDERIAEALAVPLERVRSIAQRFGSCDVSFDAPQGCAAGLTSSFPKPDALVEVNELRQLLLKAMRAAKLEPREWHMLEQRLLTAPGCEPSLAEVGRQLNISREWSRRIEQKALAKLRLALDEMELKATG